MKNKYACLTVFVVLTFIVSNSLGQDVGEIGSADLNGDGKVNVADFLLFLDQYGKKEGDQEFVTDLKARDILPTLLAMEERLNALGGSGSAKLLHFNATLYTYSWWGGEIDDVERNKTLGPTFKLEAPASMLQQLLNDAPEGFVYTLLPVYDLQSIQYIREHAWHQRIWQRLGPAYYIESEDVFVFDVFVENYVGLSDELDTLWNDSITFGFIAILESASEPSAKPTVNRREFPPNIKRSPY